MFPTPYPPTRLYPLGHFATASCVLGPCTHWNLLATFGETHDTNVSVFPSCEAKGAFHPSFVSLSDPVPTEVPLFVFVPPSMALQPEGQDTLVAHAASHVK